jgi:hypothetical protein
VQGQKLILFSIVSRPVLGLIKPSIQWISEALSAGVKRLRREGEHTPPPSAEIKNGGIIFPLYHASAWRNA